MSASPPIVVVGVGSVCRADDGVGAAVLEDLCRLLPDRPTDLRMTVCPGDAAGLIGLWEDAWLAVVIDACLTRPGQEGAITRRELTEGRSLFVSPGARHSTHGLGLSEALELSGLLDRRPERLVLYTVGVTDVSRCHGLTPPVAAAVPQVAERVAREVRDAGRTAM